MEFRAEKNAAAERKPRRAESQYSPGAVVFRIAILPGHLQHFVFDVLLQLRQFRLRGFSFLASVLLDFHHFVQSGDQSHVGLF